VVHSAAPDLLGLFPGILCANGAIEWVTSGRRIGRRGLRGCWRRRGGRRRWHGNWHRVERCWRDGRIGCGEDCARLCREAPSSHRVAAELLLIPRPQHLEICKALFAIVRKRSGRGQSGEKPAQQWDQEQQTQQAARCDQTCEVPSRSDNIEIAATSHILVGRLLNVLTLTASYVGQGTIACTTSTATHSACTGLLPRAHAATCTVSIGAAHCTGIATIGTRNSCGSTMCCTSAVPCTPAVPCTSAVPCTPTVGASTCTVPTARPAHRECHD